MTETVQPANSLRATARELWNFVRRPYLPSADLRGMTRANLAGVGRLLVVNALLNLGLLLLLGAIENAPEPTEVEKFGEQFPFWAMALIGVLVLPIVEELLFRSWLSGLVSDPPRWFHTAFPAIYWLQALGFSSAHLTNYGELNSPLVLLGVLPHLISGLIYGYARVRFGWWASALLHIAYNGSLTVPVAIGMALGAEL